MHIILVSVWIAVKPLAFISVITSTTRLCCLACGVVAWNNTSKHVAFTKPLTSAKVTVRITAMCRDHIRNVLHIITIV